jgi:hypothetical protein
LENLKVTLWPLLYVREKVWYNIVTCPLGG